MEELEKGYDLPLEESNVARVVVVKVDSELYNTNDREENKELIRRILAKADAKGNID